jgi:hypothetical protein
MKRNQSFVKLMMVAMMIMAAQFAIGSFIGSTSSHERKDRYSLKNLNRSSLKNYSLSGFTAGSLRYSGSQVVNLQRVGLGNTVQVNSIVRFEKGNTSYVFPYKYNVKLPKFKAPTASSIR